MAIPILLFFSLHAQKYVFFFLLKSSLSFIGKRRILDLAINAGLTIFFFYRVDSHLKCFTHESIKYLGRNYQIKGEVIEGNGVGRELEFPTANIKVDTINQIIPKNGVYFIKTKINNKNYYGMCNIGYRPTVSNEDIISVEVHIFNYSTFDLYTQFIEIEFVDYVRNETKFKNKEELKLQLIKDKGYCKSLQI